jgi:selenocysteine lyase/cysteine desulfurase
MKSTTDYTRLTDYEFAFFDDARRFEVVTLSYHDFAVANASTALLLELGVASVGAQLDALGDRIVEWAQSRPDVRLVTPARASHRAGVVSFAPTALDEMAARLKRAHVTFTVREGAIRLSPHCYNTMDEIERVLALLER